MSHQSTAYDISFEKDAPAWLILNSKRGGMQWDGTAFSGYQLIENDTKVYLYLVPGQKPESVAVLSDIFDVPLPKLSGARLRLPQTRR